MVWRIAYLWCNPPALPFTVGATGTNAASTATLVKATDACDQGPDSSTSNPEGPAREPVNPNEVTSHRLVWIYILIWNSAWANFSCLIFPRSCYSQSNCGCALGRLVSHIFFRRGVILMYLGTLNTKIKTKKIWKIRNNWSRAPKI